MKKLQGLLAMFLTLLMVIYMSTGYASGAAIGLRSKTASGILTTSASSELSVGAAKVKIPLPDNFFPYTSFRGRYFTGVHDDLYVRVITIGNKINASLLISIDNGDVSDEWLPQISKLSGVPECNIYFAATHTHEAPYIGSTFYETTLQDVEKSIAYKNNAWKALSEAVQTAKKNMQPAKIAFANGSCDINVNRDYKYTGNQSEITAPYITDPNPHGICDKTVAVMKFVDMSEKPIAYFINYSIHSYVMYQSKVKDNGMFISGDIAGATSRYVEDRSPVNCVAMWTMACSADTQPKYVSAYDVFDAQGNLKTVDSGAAGYVLLDEQAQELGTEVLRVGANMTNFTSKAALAGITKTITVPGQVKWDDNPATLPKGYKYQDGPAVDLRLGLLLINNVAFVGIPGELVTSVGQTLKKTMISLNCTDALVVTNCNGSVQYMSDDDGYKNQTFSAIASHCKAGVGNYIIKGESDMLKALKSE